MEVRHQKRIVSEIARGLRPWADLELLGLTIRRERHGMRGPTKYVIEDSQGADLRARVVDVAEGLLRFQSSPRELSDWASAILALLDFQQFERDQVGGLLLDALWDACFESEISSDAMQAARRISGMGEGN